MARVYKCAGCEEEVHRDHSVELWGSRFCSTCFITRSQDVHRELKPEDLVKLQAFARELAGMLPPEPLEMVATGFYRRITGKKDAPPKEALELFTLEIQRLVMFSTSRKVLTLLQSLKEAVTQFVDGQEEEVRETIRRLTSDST